MVPLAAAAIPAIIGAAGGVAQAGISSAGKAEADAQRREAQMRLERALARFGEIPLPVFEQIQAEVLGPARAAQIRADPQLKAAQMRALDQLNAVAQSGGRTLADEAENQHALGEIARNESAGRARIAEAATMRGGMTSGSAMAMQLANQQNAAERAQPAGLSMAASAQKRALDAMSERGRLAGHMRGQDVGERTAAAQAGDYIDRFNQQSREKAKYHNATQPQQHFQNQMARTSGMTGLEQGIAGSMQKQADQTQGFYAGLGKTAADAGFALADLYDDSKDKKDA